MRACMFLSLCEKLVRFFRALALSEHVCVCVCKRDQGGEKVAPPHTHTRSPARSLTHTLAYLSFLLAHIAREITRARPTVKDPRGLNLKGFAVGDGCLGSEVRTNCVCACVCAFVCASVMKGGGVGRNN